MTVEYDTLTGSTPAEKLKIFGIVAGAGNDLPTFAALSARFGIPTCLFFKEDLAGNLPLELVIKQYKDIPEGMRPYVRI